MASLGPASWSDDMLAKMIQAFDVQVNASRTSRRSVRTTSQAGTDIFRLNCSHRRGASLSLAPYHRDDGPEVGGFLTFPYKSLYKQERTAASGRGLVGDT